MRMYSCTLALALTLALLQWCTSADAFAYWMENDHCDRSITPGTVIMNQPAVRAAAMEGSGTIAGAGAGAVWARPGEGSGARTGAGAGPGAGANAVTAGSSSSSSSRGGRGSGRRGGRVRVFRGAAGAGAQQEHQQQQELYPHDLYISGELLLVRVELGDDMAEAGAEVILETKGGAVFPSGGCAGRRSSRASSFLRMPELPKDFEVHGGDGATHEVEVWAGRP
jgi:hypothetical protein